MLFDPTFNTCPDAPIPILNLVESSFCVLISPGYSNTLGVCPVATNIQ